MRWPRRRISRSWRPSNSNLYTNGTGDLFLAANTAATLLGASVVSQSFGYYLEGSGYGYLEGELDANYYAPAVAANPNVTFLASTGDSGAYYGTAFPSVDPNVIGVGGTTLSVTGSDGYMAARLRGPAAAVASATIPNRCGRRRPETGFRTVPDISSDANPETGRRSTTLFYGGTGTRSVAPSLASPLGAAWTRWPIRAGRIGVVHVWVDPTQDVALHLYPQRGRHQLRSSWRRSGGGQLLHDITWAQRLLRRPRL